MLNVKGTTGSHENILSSLTIIDNNNKHVFHICVRGARYWKIDVGLTI